MFKDQRLLLAFSFMLSAIFLTGCATTEYKPLPGSGEIPQAEKKAQGVYHKVIKGQTLFRIAKAYGVSVEEIIQSNQIPNAADIEVNQLIFILGAKEAKDIPSLTPDKRKEEFAWPLKGKIISYFKDQRGESFNRGVDIEASEADPVKACREGHVVLADYIAGYGQTLMVDHGDGFISVYAQNRVLLSKVGDHVYKGDPIAQVGGTGKRNFVHFELRKGEEAVNPLYYLPSS